MSSEAAQKAGGGAMSTRDELIADLSRGEWNGWKFNVAMAVDAPTGYEATA